MHSADQIASEILKQTEAMVKVAQTGDLDQFQTLQASRDKLVHQLELEALAIENPDQVRADLIRTKELNTLLSDALTEEQQKLLNEKSSLKRNQRARAAYKSNS